MKNQMHAISSRRCWSSWTSSRSSHLGSQLQLQVQQQQAPHAGLQGVKLGIQTSSLGQPKTGRGCLRHRRTFTTTSTNNHRPSNLQRRNANAVGGGGKPIASSSPEAASSAHGSNIPSHVYHQRVGTGAIIGPYGLRRIDYSTPPPKWPLPPHPPPHANPFRRYFPHFLIATAATLLSYVYVNREDEESVQEYWKAVEQGNAPLSMTRDDDDNDDDDLEDGYDLDRDEWEDDNDKVDNKK